MSGRLAGFAVAGGLPLAGSPPLPGLPLRGPVIGRGGGLAGVAVGRGSSFGRAAAPAGLAAGGGVCRWPGPRWLGRSSAGVRGLAVGRAAASTGRAVAGAVIGWTYGGWGGRVGRGPPSAGSPPPPGLAVAGACRWPDPRWPLAGVAVARGLPLVGLAVGGARRRRPPSKSAAPWRADLLVGQPRGPCLRTRTSGVEVPAPGVRPARPARRGRPAPRPRSARRPAASRSAHRSGPATG